MKFLFAAASAAALLAAGSASAQMAPGQFYGNLAYTQYGAEAQGTGAFAGRTTELDPGAVTARLGGRFTPYLGAEAQASFGVRDSEFSNSSAFGGVTATSEGSVSINNEFGAFGVGFLPISPSTDLFARVGVGRLSVETQETVRAGTFTTNREIESESTFVGFGAGGQYFFDGLNGVRAEYTHYELDAEEGEGTEGSIGAFSIGYVRKF